MSETRDDDAAFIFVRALHRPLTWLQELVMVASAISSSSAVHLVQKSALTARDEACVRSVGAGVVIHHMNAEAAELGPFGGRECTGYIFWLLRNWHMLPAHMFFMHESPDSLTPRSLSQALGSTRGFTNLLPDNAAILRCFGPARASATAARKGSVDGSFFSAAAEPSTAAQAGGSSQLIVRTSYELPAGLKHLLHRVGISAPRCVLTPCCANFHVRREAVLRRTRAELMLVDAYVRRRAPFAQPTPPTDGRSPAWPPTPCHALEHAWHLLFGEPPLLSPLPPRTLRAGKQLRCCRVAADTREAAAPLTPISGGRRLSRACAPQACPLELPVPCAADGPRGLHATNLVAMQLIRALLRDDRGCSLEPRPTCGGGDLLGGSRPLAEVWNESLSRAAEASR